jgi:hypothetical protein
MTLDRRPPRLLPTLTEIVQPHSKAAETSEAAVRRIVEQVTPVLLRQIQHTVDALVRAQVESLKPDIQREVSIAVQAAAEKAVREDVFFKEK